MIEESESVMSETRIPGKMKNINTASMTRMSVFTIRERTDQRYNSGNLS